MCTNTYTAKETSFWKFIRENEIEIPIIQRDYAQGRVGEENLRKNFLSDLKKALNNEKPYDNKVMKLDFVYGSIESQKMNPLDGQQRLTTLWLLHWYIALMADKLDKGACENLKKFSYETRITSREFCKELCKPNNFKDFYNYKPKESRRIVSYIKSRTWFYSAWNQDPTIQSMLRMLGGTKITDKKGEDIVDGIEELFVGTDTDKFNDYWEKLISPDNAPIVFYHLPLKDFGLSDDLYIKMNARGKQLTSFENFKADLIGYIKQQAKNEDLDKDQQDKWEKLLDPEEGIPILMDTKWTDVFWKNKSKDNKIDEIYFAFLNRFFLCELICQKGNNDYIYSAEGLEKKNSTFRHLYGKESNDANIEYVGWEMYGDIPLAYFNDLNTALDNHIENFQEFFPDWAKKDSQLQFIPGYKEDNAITTLTQSERVAFHAISKYLQKGKFDKIKFRQWMRVVWNIVENANINSIATMIGAMRLIDELGEHSHEIYEFLANEKSEIKSEAVKGQVKEEIDKAKQILNGEQRSDGKTWKEIIIEAENYAFFKGAIRFLFTDGEGNINWCDFNTKWTNAKEYFNKDGQMVENYQKEAVLLRYYISNFKKWWEFWNFVYDNNPSTWKQILLSKRYTANHKILMYLLTEDYDFSSFESNLVEYGEGYKELQEKVQNELVKTKILVESSKWSMKLNWRDDHNTYCLYPYNTKAEWKIYVIGNKRNHILSEIQTIKSSQKIVGLNFFWGWNINFEYNDHIFQWNTDGRVYLMDKDGKRMEKNELSQEKFYCFNAEEITDSSMLEESLNKLINLYPTII